MLESLPIYLQGKNLFVRLLIFFAIGVLCIGRSLQVTPAPYVTGDGFEYILMTEAFSNHATPDITLQDIESFKQKLIERREWEPLQKKQFLADLSHYLQYSNKNYKDNLYGFYCNKNKKWYSFHFFFYSLVSVPAYKLCTGAGPLRSFYITNAILIVLTVGFIIFFAPFGLFSQLVLAACFYFSSCYWYIGWQHTEVITCCLVTVAMLSLFGRKFYAALFFMALASLQNQPLVLMAGFIGLVTLYEKGLSLKNIIIVAGLCSIALIPPVFYYINFGTTNLIKDAGFLDKKFITFNRVLGFYFDVNQGIILAIPLILLSYIPLLLADLKNALYKKTAAEPFLLVPVVLIVISIISASMSNWNHGMAIVNRYATWMSCIIMCHAFYLACKHTPVFSGLLLSCFLLTQVATTLYHEQFNKNDWSQYVHRPLAKWLLNNYPEAYSPDPYIFSWRTSPNKDLTEANSPFIYVSGKTIKKVMFHKRRINDLRTLGVSEEDIKRIKKETRFRFGWGYVKDFKSKFSDDSVMVIIDRWKLQKARQRILSSPQWTDQVKQKAKNWNKTFEEVLEMDANYIITEDAKAESLLQ